MKFLKDFFFCNLYAQLGTSFLIALILMAFAIFCCGLRYEPQVKENKFITDINGCQYFKKSERPRYNPNGTQVCKPL